MRVPVPLLLSIPLALLACSSEDSAEDDGGTGGGGTGGNPPAACSSHAECTDPSEPVCDPDLGVCVAPKPGHYIGWGDGTPTSVSLVPVYMPPREMHATDLAFHPDRPNELWILRRELASTAPCTSTNQTFEGCTSLEGSVAVVWFEGVEPVGTNEYTDPNAWHFMRRPPAFAFGENSTFASVGEHRTGNFLDDPVDYIGPSLWSSALPGVVAGCETHPDGCFSLQPPGGNGSHLDMLHLSPFAVGIAHEAANIYWVFNGNVGSLDRYDFHDDHGPGNEDHSDGEMWRYAEGQLTRVPDVPSHMEYDPATKQLYVADTGAGRVVALDTTSGVEAGAAQPNYDNLATCKSMNANLREVVPPGKLTAPSGLALHEGVLYVTDHATSRIHAFDTEGNELNVLDTGLAPNSLAGFTIGSNGRAFFVDMPAATVYRIDPL